MKRLAVLTVISLIMIIIFGGDIYSQSPNEI